MLENLLLRFVGVVVVSLFSLSLAILLSPVLIVDTLNRFVFTVTHFSPFFLIFIGSRLTTEDNTLLIRGTICVYFVCMK